MELDHDQSDQCKAADVRPIAKRSEDTALTSLN